MKKIRAIQTTMTELGELLKVLTDEGALIGIEENWEDTIDFVVSFGEILSNDIVKEKLTNHFRVEKIEYWLINDDGTVLLVFETEDL